MTEEYNNENKQEVETRIVRAGKRTYFFDIKSTRNNDLYLTITESKKSFSEGSPSFKKHKIFIYKEDFEDFKEVLNESIDKILELKKSGKYIDDNPKGYSSVDFDDLK